MKTYKEVLDFLYSQLPLFQRVGPAAYKADLGNTIELCKILGNPERNLRSIHIAGTNGKGSCSHILASVFQEAGYKTGLYTSPHLKDFRERIRIDGKMIPEKEIIDFVNQHKEKFVPVQPSFFELTVGLAFEYFSKQKVDIVILETGLGGRLDSTNVVTPELSIITNIGTDHTNFLGDTYEKIAFEKAGIIKNNIPVVIGETHPATEPVFREKANEKSSSIYFADKELQLHNIKLSLTKGKMEFDVFKNDELLFKQLKTDLFGNFQLKNLVTTLQSLLLLKDIFTIPQKAFIKGFQKVKTNTGFAGRWHVLSELPFAVADTGHNPEGVQQVLHQIETIGYDRLHIVLGMVNDKNIDNVLSILPKQAIYYFCKADIPRGMPVNELEEKAGKFDLKGIKFTDVMNAYKSAVQNARNRDIVFIGGSTFTVAEVL